MTTRAEQGIKNLTKVCNEYGLKLSCMPHEKYPTQAWLNFSIEGVNFKSNEFDNDDYNNIADAVSIWADTLSMPKFIEELKLMATVNIWSDTFEEYVKESYRFSKSNLKNLLNIALNQCSYAVDRWQDLADKKANYKFTDCHSAFLYKGYYITPYIMTVTLNEAIKNMKKAKRLQILFNLYYNGNKVNNDTIINDTLNDLFNNDNNERLMTMYGLIEDLEVEG